MKPDHRTAQMGNRKWEIGRVLFPISYFLLPLLLTSACSWFTDFRQQPKMDPWETPNDTIAMRGNPQMSVSIYGTAAPGFAYGRGTLPAVIDSMSSIQNPVASDQRSISNGRMQYQINCAVCHGERGMGDGPVAQFGFPPMPIGTGSKTATQYSDGYVFGMIRNGRGLMPPYNRIDERERWDLINYLRALQAGTPSLPVGPAGRPGETGNHVPGPSVDAPTRPAPHVRPGSPTTTTPAPAAPRTP